MYVLGIHLGHDASACLLHGTQIVGATQEERFSRRKNQGGFPSNSISYLLQLESIRPHNIGAIAIAGRFLGEEIPAAFLRATLIHSSLYRGLAKSQFFLSGLLGFDWFRRFVFNQSRTEKIIRSHLRELGFDDSVIHFYDHHRCHAASAYYSSPFSDAVIFTQDGKGDHTSGSVHLGRDGRLEEIYRQPAEDSIGQIYAEVTRYLGFRPARHEGKITGLAASGDPTATTTKFNSLLRSINGSIQRANLGPGILHSFRRRSLLNLIKHRALHPNSIPYAYGSLKLQRWLNGTFSATKREDVAAGVQAATEAWVVSHVESVLNGLKSSDVDVCLAGGLFANVRVNQKVRESIGVVRNVFVQPAMSDCGLSLGAAQLFVYEQSIEKFNPYTYFSPYLGASFREEAIREALMKYAGRVSVTEPACIEQSIAEKLANGKVVGRFVGRTEWGPRSLGNRSILAHPGRKEVNDEINKRLKRSEFMPFAPSVLDYRMEDYFEKYSKSDASADHMTITYDVKASKVSEIAAVVHVDLTARPQRVTREAHPSFYNVLVAFEKITGIGCLVNTSFNLHEEPIVNSPDDAINTLLAGSVDFLAIEKWLVEINHTAIPNS